MDHQLMQNAEKYNTRHRRKKLWEKIVCFLGCVVVFCTTYALILPALTLERSVYCGMEEHQHGEECYERVSVCGLEESEPVVHIHDDECYTWGLSLICPEEETFAGHTHTAECVAVEQVLVCADEDPEHEHTDACCETVERYICGLEEGVQYVHIHSDECYIRTRIDVPICGYEDGEAVTGGHVHTDECYELRLICQEQEHVHTQSCYADPGADLENAVAWMRSVSGVEVTGVWRDDLIAIAGTQLNYQESSRNYIVDEAGVQHGYSRYGAWYGDPYGDWDAMFVSFCMSYAKIPADVMPSEGSCASWIMQLRNRGMYRDAMGYTPNTGDVVFFDLNGDGAVDHMGLVHMVENGMVYTIEGDAGDAVRTMEYYLMDSHILGYGVMPNSPIEETAELEQPEEENPAEEENPEENPAEEPAEEPDGGEEPVEEEPGEETVKPSMDPEPIDLADVPDSITAFAQLLPSPVSAPVQQILRTRSMTPMSMAAMGAANGVMALGMDDVPQAGGELDFKNLIKDVTVEYRVNQWSSWLPVTPDTVIDVSYELRIGLSYEIPGCSLTKDDRVISYQLPGGIKPEVECTGKVKNAQMVTVGEYCIDTTGKITITFDETYAAENAAGKIIEGAISCEAKVSSINTEGGKTIELPFNDQLTLTFQVEDQKQDERDLAVTKKAVKLNEADGTVQYTIEVTSEQGTDNEVHLSDVMTNIGLIENIFVECNGEYTITQQSPERFDITLPKMEPNSKYIITYTAQLLDTNYETSVTAKNDVTATSTKNNGGELTGSDHTDTTFVKTYIEKKGSYNGWGGEDNTIDWTITVNQSRQDIGGWTLQDTMNGVAFIGPVTIRPALPGGVTQIILPYTFPEGSTDTYIITYTTDADKELGTGSAHNVAELIPPGSEEPGYSADAWQGDWSEYNPLSKEAVELENQGDGTAIIKWYVTINADQGDILAPWTYHDALWNKQHFTEEQLDALEKELEQVLSGMDYTFTRTYGNDPGYKIEFNTTLKKGKTIEFTYYSTAPLGDGSSPMTFKNTANINQKVYAQGQITYKPSTVQVTKKDKNENGYGDTSHGYYDDKMTVNGEPGILQWYVNVTIPPEYNDGDLTLTETLPDGVELRELEIRAEGVTGAWNITADAKAHTEFVTLTRNEGENQWSIQVKQVGQTITIVIPKESLAAKRTDGSYTGQPLENIILVVGAKIPDDYNWPKSGDEERASFTNHVEVSTSSSTSSDQQTQTVVKNYSKEVLKKSAADPTGAQKDQHEYEDNQIPYTIHINPEGRDLVENSDKIILVDELKFENTDSNASGQLGAGLLLNTLKVYYREPDGSRGAALETDKYSVQYETSDSEGTGVAWNTATYTVRRLRVTLPDQTPLIVEYTYQISGAENNWFTITNNARLEGVGNSDSGDSTSTSIQISKAGATANLKSVTVYKVDSDDNKIPIPGATFQLSAYDMTSQEFIKVGTTGTTDNSGVLSLAELIDVEEPGKSGSLEYWKPYRLEETKAPNGYLVGEPYYFYIVDPSGGTFKKPPTPEGVEWHAHQASDMIYYRDSRTTTSITVNKRWFNKDGSNATSTTTGAGSIQFNLYQIAPGGELSDSKTSDDMVEISFDLRNPHNSSLGWDGVAPGIKWVLKGSMVTVSISHPNWGADYLTTNITVNDEPVQISEGTTSNVTNRCTHVYSFIAEGDAVIGGSINWNPVDDVTVEISAAARTLVAGSPYTITAGAGQTWETTISGLPRASEDGSIIYTYCVEELPVNGYDTTYENNYITSGTVTIRNTSTENPGYQLPETGGTGTKLYTIGGAVMVAGALTYRLVKKRKRRRAAERINF